jgi:hypothetical protein
VAVASPPKKPRQQDRQTHIGTRAGGETPTPDKTAQTQRYIIKAFIDLDDLPLRPLPGVDSSKILGDILKNYRATTLAIIKFGVLGPVISEQYIYASEPYIREAIEEVRAGGDEEAAIEKIARWLAEERGKDIIVVKLKAGVETAVAFVASWLEYIF